MLKIRLRRMGSRHRPFYRVVVSDARNVPNAAAIDEIGYYDPRKNPTVLQLDIERYDSWVAKGAQPSDTVAKLSRRVRTSAEDELVGANDAKAATDRHAKSAAAETAADEPAPEVAEEAAAEPVAEEAAEPSAEAATDEPAADGDA